MSAVVQLDAAAIKQFMTGTSGPVARYLMEKGEQVKNRAIARAGRSADTDASHGQHLKDAIVKRFVATPTGPSVVVSANTPYAKFHHEGTPPHVIMPRTASVLSFRWPKAANFGRARVLGESFVFYKHVMHPGTKANHFLTDALHDVFG